MFLVQEGTNHTHVDPNKNETDAIFVNLVFGERARLTNGWPVELDCISFKSSQSGSITEWPLEFGPSALERFRTLIPTNSIVKDATLWDTAELDASFLPKDSVILEGHITLLVNSFRREIPIRLQTVSSMSKVWPGRNSRELQKQGHERCSDRFVVGFRRTLQYSMQLTALVFYCILIAMKLPSPLEMQLLALVADDERSGREVAKLYKQEIGETIGYGSLYTCFRRMVEAGWVTVRDDKDEDGRVRFFKIDVDGRRALTNGRGYYAGISSFGLSEGRAA